jgi:hypothetical protein
VLEASGGPALALAVADARTPAIDALLLSVPTHYHVFDLLQLGDQRLVLTKSPYRDLT